MPKTKNIIIFAVVAVLLILGYIFFIKPAPEQQDLISSSTGSTSNTASSGTNTGDNSSSISNNFLSILLSVKSIKLNDQIFSDAAFINLHDSSILLTPLSPGDEGRPNPFAPIGSDITTPPPVIPSVLAPVIPPPTDPTPAPTKTPSENVKTP